jgi:hypothetical protein
MALRFKCRGCGKDIVVDASMARHLLKCGACGAGNIVPTTSEMGVLEKPAATILSVEEVRRKSAGRRALMTKHLRTWGIVLLILGAVHIAAGRVLDPIWGAIIIVIGILNLIIRERGMFIVNGTALMFVGIMNISGSWADRSYGWILLGVFQFFWGMAELKNFPRYKGV